MALQKPSGIQQPTKDESLFRKKKNQGNNRTVRDGSLIDLENNKD